MLKCQQLDFKIYEHARKRFITSGPGQFVGCFSLPEILIGGCPFYTFRQTYICTLFVNNYINVEIFGLLATRNLYNFVDERERSKNFLFVTCLNHAG